MANVVRVAGVDEVGRGALLGPVVAAAVVLDHRGRRQLQALGVTDSKALSPSRREQLAARIEQIALAASVGSASVADIDRLNILQATFLAMGRAIAAIDPPPDLCAIDGNRAIPDLGIPQRTVVRGDRQEVAIGAASIVAKVWRDHQIIQLATRYPHYDLARNKGYGTAAHRAALLQFGVTPEHRLSFAPCRQAKRACLSGQAADREAEPSPRSSD